MYSLILDSATKNLYICLLKDDKVLEEIYIKGQNDHSKNIVSKLDLILKNSNITPNDLDEIIVGYGPGSYTGVRMAVTVGKMISTNTLAKLYSFSSLYMLSSGYDGKVLPYIDARRGNSFNALYDNDKIILEDSLRNTEEVFNKYLDYQKISEDMIKVNPIKAVNSSKEEKNPHGLVPNYLRETEAERNLK